MPRSRRRVAELPRRDAYSDRQPDPLDAVDTTAAHSARVWNYWLGGKDNFAPDRIAGDRLMEIFEGLELVEPGLVSCTRWRPAPDDPQANVDVPQFCGVARKP